jgi:hypothetical protein
MQLLKLPASRYDQWISYTDEVVAPGIIRIDDYMLSRVRVRVRCYGGRRKPLKLIEFRHCIVYSVDVLAL